MAMTIQNAIVSSSHQNRVYPLALTILDPNLPIQPYSDVPPQTQTDRCNDHAHRGDTPGIGVAIGGIVEIRRDPSRRLQSRRFEQRIQLFRRHVEIDPDDGAWRGRTASPRDMRPLNTISRPSHGEPW